MGVQHLCIRVSYYKTGESVVHFQPSDDFMFSISQMTSRTRLKRKEVDDVLGGDDMWKHADSTAGTLLDLTKSIQRFADNLHSGVPEM